MAGNQGWTGDHCGAAEAAGTQLPAQALAWLQRMAERLPVALALEDSQGKVQAVVGESVCGALFGAAAAGGMVPRLVDVAGPADGQPVEQRVAGLHRLVWPIVVADQVVACLTVGPFVRAGDPADAGELVAEAGLRGLDPDTMVDAAERLPVFDPGALAAVSSRCQLLCTQLAGVLTAGLAAEAASAATGSREARYREHCAALHDLVAALDELLVCSRHDDLWRQAVTLAQQRLHLDRCAIFVRDGQVIRGTWGTDRHGRLTDERMLTHPLNGYWRSVMEPWEAMPLWRVEESAHSELAGGQTRVFGKGWVAVTQLRAGTEVVGVMCNDDAVTGQPFDPDRQNVVALYCTLVAGLAERIAAEERLREQTARSLEASKLQVLGQLAGGVAHEFNNLLSVILGHVDLALMDAQLPDGVRGHLDAVCQAAERSGDLVRQLLTFSRGKAGAGAAADLNQVLQEARAMLAILLGKHRELVYRLGPGLPEVAMGAPQLQEILLSLTLNAAAAMGDEGRLTVQTAVDETGAHVVWQVTDTGCGMSDEVRRRVFEPFYTTREPGQGTGLGLSAVYGLVSHGQGTIDCASQPGAGTTITIRLPVATGDAPSAAHNTPGETAP